MKTKADANTCNIEGGEGRGREERRRRVHLEVSVFKFLILLVKVKIGQKSRKLLKLVIFRKLHNSIFSFYSPRNWLELTLS